MPTQLPQAIVPLVRLSTSGLQNVGVGKGDRSGSLAIGSFLPLPMPNVLLGIGGVSQEDGSLVPDIDLNLSPFCRRPREYLSHHGLCPIIIPARERKD